jgi:1,4-alpha-glucan branching enzyme
MQSLDVDRGIALHKMIRLVTIATAGNGYLNFMGNEFGHPEWIDFPREGNNWSHAYARRQWSLADSPFLRYGKLLAFDKKMIHLFAENSILSQPPVSIYNDQERQIMVLERNGFVFVFNFSPNQSYSGYRINIFGGEYSVVLDTDWKEFNGYERNRKKQTHYTLEDDEGTFLSLYLPARTAFVLKRKLVK